jgi:D-alanyl-D-alanine carboxypeptidase/D-alanyl-D-alanine-endopeptidase (penicillin-binding protein 4)
VDEARLRPRTAHGTDPRTPNPSRSAAQAFARLLRSNGVHVTGTPGRTRAAKGAQRLAAVSSPPVSALVEQALPVSDNDLAEALARQVAVAKGMPASFSGAAAAVRQVLAELGVDPAGMATYDGSGLSRRDRIPARVLAQVLATAASSRHPELRAALTGLPVAGFTGTLEDRFDTGTAAKAVGVVRAKTGTLSGVNTLAGLTEDADGRLLAFAFMADQVPPGASGKAPGALDRLAAAVTACGCR